MGNWKSFGVVVKYYIVAVFVKFLNIVFSFVIKNFYSLKYKVRLKIIRK